MTRSVKDFVFIGVLPVLGGLMLTGLFLKSFYIDLSKGDARSPSPSIRGSASGRRSSSASASCWSASCS